MAQFSQLFLFDSDPSGLEALTYGLEKDGRAVFATGDPTKARELVLGAGQSLLVLVHLRAPEQVGLDLLRAISTNPRTRNLACIAIGPQESRVAAIAAGAFVFLSMPLFVRDVVGACRLVGAATIPGSRPSPDTELALKLSDLDGLYYLMRSLAVTGRSTVVELRRGNKRGELRFIEGVLTSADLGAVQGLPALHHLLLWDDADVRFKFRNVVRRGTQLSMRSNEILEECDRFLRDFAHEVADLGVARTVYASNIDHVRPSAALPSEVVPVLRLFDGRQSLGQVLDESPFRIFDTLKIVRRFAADGAITLPTPLVPATPAIGPTMSGPKVLDFWLQRVSSDLGPEIGRAGATGVADRQSKAAATPNATRVTTPGLAPARTPAPAAAVSRAVEPALATIIIADDIVGAGADVAAGEAAVLGSSSGAPTGGGAIAWSAPTVDPGPVVAPTGVAASTDAAAAAPGGVASRLAALRSRVSSNGVSSNGASGTSPSTGNLSTTGASPSDAPLAVGGDEPRKDEARKAIAAAILASSVVPPAVVPPAATQGPAPANPTSDASSTGTASEHSVAEPRARTTTRKEHAIQASVVVAVENIVSSSPTALAADVLAAAGDAGDAIAVDATVAPPATDLAAAVSSTAASASAPAVDDALAPPLSDVTAKPSSALSSAPSSAAARGEITVARSGPIHAEVVSAAVIPTVVVELGPLPAQTPPVHPESQPVIAPAISEAPAAAAAVALPAPAEPPRVVAATATVEAPAVVAAIVAAPIVREAPVAAPVAAPAVAADAPPPPSIIISAAAMTPSLEAPPAPEPMPSIIVLASAVAALPAPANVVAAPVVEVLPAAVVANHVGRSPAHGFSDVEADFFNREADLYKRVSVETFDDLDRGPDPAPSLRRSPSKR